METQDSHVNAWMAWLEEQHCHWHDATLDACTYWGDIEGVGTLDAAMLLCGLHPDETTDEAATKSSQGENFKRLRKVFADVAEHHPASRTLQSWLGVARDKGLPYDHWIDGYARVKAMQAPPPEQSTAPVVAETTEQPAPAQNTATPAPVVTVVAAGGVEPDKAGLVHGLLTKEIAVTFDGVNGWNESRWHKNLSSSKWLHPARIALGAAGGASAVWNPLTLAQLMHSKTKGDKERERVMKVCNSRFTRNPELMPWRDAFNEYFATHCTTD